MTDPDTRTRRARRLHDMRSKWGDCYWRVGDNAYEPEKSDPTAADPCADFVGDLIEFENDVRADFTKLLRRADLIDARLAEGTDR